MARKMAKAKGLAGVLAMRGGVPAVKHQAPSWPVTGEEEVSWMEAVVRSGQWSWKGPHEMAFSDEFRNFIGSRYCLCQTIGVMSV